MAARRTIRESRGSILLEAGFAITLSMFAFLLNLELARRAQFEVVLHRIAFFSARERALGVSWPRLRREAKQFLRLALNFPGPYGNESHFVSDGSGARTNVRVHLRYPSLIRFTIPGSESRRGRTEQKHHFEITQSCRFP